MNREETAVYALKLAKDCALTAFAGASLAIVTVHGEELVKAQQVLIQDVKTTITGK